MSKPSRPRMMPTDLQDLVNPAAVLIGLTLAMGMRNTHRCIPPAAMSVGLTLAMAPLVPLANKSLQRIPNLIPLSFVQRGRKSLIALARKLPRYLANELVTMLLNLALWLASSVLAASVLPATSFMLGIVAVSGPRLESMPRAVKPIYHGSGSVWVPVACLAVTALGDSWRLPLRRNFRAWYIRKTGTMVKTAPAMVERSPASLNKARQAATFSLVTRVGLYYGLRQLAGLAWIPSRIVLQRALTLHPALPFSLDYWQMLEGFLTLQYQLAALMQCFWYTMSVCARFALPTLENHWGLLEAELLTPRHAVLVENDVAGVVDVSDYAEASEGEDERHFITIIEAGPSRSARVSPSDTSATASTSSSPAEATTPTQRGSIVHAVSFRNQSISTSKPRRPAGFDFELSPSQRGALAAQRAARKAAYDSRRIISEMNSLTRNNSQPAEGSGLRKRAQATDGEGAGVALSKTSESDRSPLPKLKDVKGKGKARESLSQTRAECKEDDCEASNPGHFGGEDGTGSYCVIEESTLSLPMRGSRTAASKAGLDTEAEAKGEGATEITSAAGESSQGGLTRASSYSSPQSSSSSSSASPRSSRHTRTPSAAQSAQIRHIDSFMDLNLEYATLRAPRRESNAAQQPAAASPAASPASAAAASSSTPAATASSVADGGLDSYDWEKRRYLQGARGSFGRRPQW